MKKQIQRFTITAITAVSVSLLSTCLYAAEQPQITTEKDRISYVFGVDIGKTFKSQEVELDKALLFKGIEDGMQGTHFLMSQKDMEATLVAFQKKWVSKREEAFKEISEKNKVEGEKFLSENKTKPGVITLPSGLQYKVLTPGRGATPVEDDMVTVEYTGQFINGKVFDSSAQHGGPVTFPVDAVIPGWTEALKLMQTGATWELYIPANLAYQEYGMGPVGPNETLIFKVTLLKIQKPEKNAEENKAAPGKEGTTLNQGTEQTAPLEPSAAPKEPPVTPTPEANH